MTKWFLNLTTRTKLFAGFGLMIVLLVAVIAATYTGITAIQASEKGLYEHEFAEAVALKDIRANQNGVRAAILDMMLATGSSERLSWHQEIKDRVRRIDELAQDLAEGSQYEPGLLRGLDSLSAVRMAYQQTRDTQVIPLIYEGKMEEARKLVLGIQLERNSEMKSIVDGLVARAEKDAEIMVTQSGQQADAAVRTFAIVGVLALLLGVVMAAFISRIIANPLRELSGAAERMASGDLTVTVPADARSDEVGRLQEAFRRMVESLRRTNQEVQEGISVLASSASEIVAATTQVASGSAETATAVAETTTTMEEVKQTAQAASQKAKAVSEAAQQSVQVSQRGRQAVDETVAGIHHIQDQMAAIAESIVRLSEQGQAIGEIIATVGDLADQSNLLAVNAAIEAAKAGEQGKGFAVVAQEVKSLAEQSKQATAQVRSILGEVQKATSAAVMATEQGGKAVEAGVKQSTEAGQAIRMLADNTAEAAQAATQIAASSQQQLAGMDQVALAMENIRQASEQNVASTRQVETAAQGLHELGQKLKQLAAQYRL
ncbi:MAG: methyl-accepting chemotaxis protein [Candidatus Latescibacterota bacterium]